VSGVDPSNNKRNFCVASIVIHVGVWASGLSFLLVLRFDGIGGASYRERVDYRCENLLTKTFKLIDVAMPSQKLTFALVALLLFAVQAGCNNTSAVETLQLRFDSMKSATEAFHANLSNTTDLESAERLLDDLKASHKELAESVMLLDEAEQTSSRAARTLKKKVGDYKKEQKQLLKIEFDRIKADEELKAFLEPFLQRINAY